MADEQKIRKWERIGKRMVAVVEDFEVLVKLEPENEELKKLHSYSLEINSAAVKKTK